MQQTETALEHARGPLVWVHPKKNYGVFMVDKDREAFVHHSSYPKGSPFQLGAMCEFDIIPQEGTDRKGDPLRPKAVNVKFLGV